MKKSPSRRNSASSPKPYVFGPTELAEVSVKGHTYPNGLRVVSERVTGAASVSVGFWIKAGSRNENARNNGMAHFIEHVVFKGTAGRSMREIMRSIESRGGFLNAFTTKEHTCYYTWNRTVHLGEAVSLLFDLVTRPSFVERDIEREKAVVIEEINGLEDEPDEMVFDFFEREVFGSHPLAKPIIGTAQSVGNISRSSLVEFHRKHYRAKDITIVASGSHTHEELFAAVERCMKHLPAHVSRRAPARTALPRTREIERRFSRAAGQQAHIILGRRAPGIHSRNQMSLSALITLLGVGMSSRLNISLREERGLAYDALAFYSPFEDAGSAGLYVATAVENHEKAAKEMRRIVRGLFRQPISKPELDRTKEQMIGSFILPMESITNRMMRTATNDLYFRKYTPVEKDIERVQKLTVEDVRRTASELFEDESALMLVSVVPEKEGEET